MKDPAALKREAEQELQRMLDFDYSVSGGLPQPTPTATPLGEKGAKYLMSMTFKSSKEGYPHIATRRDDYDGTVLVSCTCEAKPGTCWAVAEFRRVAGL